MIAAAGLALGVPLLLPTAAVADTAPPAGTPPTVSADVLPTVQVNGVVWAQTVVGNTVYATGEFTRARPAGAAAGTNETVRNNILAYDLTTGQLKTSWAPSLNAQGLAITASADGTKIFVGGSFTQVGTVRRNRVAALDATTGALLNIVTTGTDAKVGTLAADGDTLYLGGIFSSAGGQARSRLAAYSISTGQVLPWNPSANAEVMSMTAVPGNNKLVVGGRFTTLNGENNYGLGALDKATAATLPFPTNTIVRNAGSAASIYHLSSTETQVFGTGYTFGSGGNFEAAFASDAATGALTWVSGCRGDTYASMPIDGVLYTVGHPHDCSMIGGLPQTNPWTFQRAMAFRTGPSTEGRVNTSGNFNGRPAPDTMHWLPTINSGSYTGQSQGAWSVSGNSQYVVLGGEFPTVNGVAQQGLVRFARSEIAPNTEGPLGRAELLPSFTGIAPGTVRASFTTAWDRDNRDLTYELLRGPQLSTAVVAATATIGSNWWSRPPGALTDSTAPPGTTQSYRIRVRDPFGNTTISDTVTATVPAGTPSSSAYRDRIVADGATSHWRLGEASGTAAFDWSGGSDLTLNNGVTRGAAGAITGDADPATTFNGTGPVPGTTTGTARPGPQTFSVEAWFRTTSTTGGKIIGFGSSATGNSSSYDRHLYLANNGRVVFGVYPGAVRTVESAPGLNNGQWHHVVGTLSPAGQQLYVDGQLVASRTDTTGAQAYNGYWRVGGDALGSWPGPVSTANLSGTVDEVAVYPTALPADRVLAHHQLGQGVVPNTPPTAAFTETATNLAVAFDGSTSTDPDGTITGYAWTFGDGNTGTGPTPQHTYGAAGTYNVTLTVTDNSNATHSVTRAVTVNPANTPPTAAFTETATDLAVAFDGSTSTDPDGTITGYAWTFGDGNTGTGPTPQHTYGAAGTYNVTLTVTDNSNATHSVTRPVTVTAAPAPTVVASDTFTRTVASGFGTADAGGAWTATGSGLTTSVVDGYGKATVGVSRTGTLRLPGVSSAGVEVAHSVALEQAATGGGAYLSTTVRSTAAGDYRARLRIQANGSVLAAVTRTVGTTESVLGTQVTVAGLTYAPGTKLLVKAQATGSAPTTVRLKVWADGTPEPATWTVSATDATDGLQTAGAIGLVAYNSGSSTGPIAVRYDDLVATGVPGV